LVLLIISIYAFDKIRFQVVSLPNEFDDEIDDHVIDSNNNNTTTTSINLRDISLSDLDDGGESHKNHHHQQQQEHIVNDDQNFHIYVPIPSLEVSNEGINNDRLSIISSGDENNSKLLSPPSSPTNSIFLNNTVMYDDEKHDIINSINFAEADNHKVNSNDLTQNVSTPPSDGHMAFEPISFAFQDIWYKVKLATGNVLMLLLMMMIIIIIIMIVMMMMMMIAMIVILYDE